MRKIAIPDLSARELHAICTVAECGGFMAASLTLEISQPALTRAVQRVELVLGVELFRRTTRRVEITSAGREFVAVANRILADLRMSVENMREIADEQRGQVIVSSVMSVAYSQLPRLVAQYRTTRPRTEIQLHEGVHDLVLDEVRSGVSDLGITYLDEVPDEFSCIVLGQEAFHVVMPAGHPLCQHDGVTLEQAAAYALVSLPRAAQTRRLLDGLASAAGLTLQHAVTVDQFATVMQCVHAGVGLGVVPGGAIAVARSTGLDSRPLSHPPLSRGMGVVLLRHRGLTPSARGFLSHLQDHWGAPTVPA